MCLVCLCVFHLHVCLLVHEFIPHILSSNFFCQKDHYIKIFTVFLFLDSVKLVSYPLIICRFCLSIFVQPHFENMVFYFVYISTSFTITCLSFIFHQLFHAQLKNVHVLSVRSHFCYLFCSVIPSYGYLIFLRIFNSHHANFLLFHSPMMPYCNVA